MGALTEIEIFDQLETSFRSAIELCDLLAVAPLKGHIYRKFRDHLKLIEGCCKQANCWREDTRWLQFIAFTRETHQRAGDWLRGYKTKRPDGSFFYVPISMGEKHQCFVVLADILRNMHKSAEQIRTKRTNKVGMILPAPLAAPSRDTRPAGWRANGASVSKGGIILPSSFATS